MARTPLLIKPASTTARIYFTRETEDAIINYNKSQDPIEREFLFRNYIHYSFDKLAENLVNSLKTYYVGDGLSEIKAEAITFMIERMHRYNPVCGRAFSFFTVITRNYLIITNRNNYKKLKTRESIDAIDAEYEPLIDISNAENREQKHAFYGKFIEYLEANVDELFPKEKDNRIAYAFIHIMKRKDYIEIFNKKALYIMIRDIANVQTTHITRIVNVLKQLYGPLYNEFCKKI